jgi:hypothetical protein
MARTIYHVTPAGDAWRVKRAGTRRADSIHSHKFDAIARAQALAKRRGLGQVKVHRHDGEIQTEYTYGKDPRRTAG